MPGFFQVGFCALDFAGGLIVIVSSSPYLPISAENLRTSVWPLSTASRRWEPPSSSYPAALTLRLPVIGLSATPSARCLCKCACAGRWGRSGGRDVGPDGPLIVKAASTPDCYVGIQSIIRGRLSTPVVSPTPSCRKIRFLGAWLVVGGFIWYLTLPGRLATWYTDFGHYVYSIGDNALTCRWPG
jgi:hypothetical protein